MPNNSAPTVAYDGDCGFCEKCALFISRRVPNVVVVSHHDLGISELSAVQLMTQTRTYSGAPAVAQILRLADSRLLRACGVALQIPVLRTVAKGVYWVVAKNRRKISQALGLRACGLPDQRTS